MANGNSEHAPRVEDGTVQAFSAIVGSEWVLTTPASVGEFHDPYEGPQVRDHRPSVVIQPSCVEEVQACLRVAQDLAIPLWTSSMGRNFGYGGSAPVVDGTAVLNLRRMNRILEIDTKQAYALIEPGVTFFQLYDALREAGAPLMMSVPDLGWGSMLGNALDHGMGYSIRGEHAESLCGLEVVLADGTLVRTGQGGIAASPIWNCHRRGYGPVIDDLFKQSNFGIVTKAGVHLEPRPEIILAGTISSQDENAVSQFIERARHLLQAGIMQGVPMLVGTPQEGGSESAEDGNLICFANLRKVLRPGRWNLRFGLYGAQELVNARMALIKSAFSDLQNADIESRVYPGDVEQDDVDPRDYITAGIPNMVLKDRLESVFGDRLGHQDFSPVMPCTGVVAQDYDRMVREVMANHGLIGAIGMLLRPRSMIGASMVLFDRTDANAVATARRAIQEMGDRARSWGCAPYRSHISLADEVASSYDFENGTTQLVLGRIKAALDPKGILAPGNHGIWLPSDTL